MYSQIRSGSDVTQLQTDLERVQNWCSMWKMNLNNTKCVHVSFTRKRNPIETEYFLNNEPVKEAVRYKYLVVVFSSDCSWSAHVSDVVGRPGRALNVMQRNLKTSELNLRKTAYLTCVRPVLDYACAVWDPSQVTLIDEVEKIQNRAARFVLGQYKRGESCTET